MARGKRFPRTSVAIIVVSLIGSTALVTTAAVVRRLTKRVDAVPAQSEPTQRLGWESGGILPEPATGSLLLLSAPALFWRPQRSRRG